MLGAKSRVEKTNEDFTVLTAALFYRNFSNDGNIQDCPILYQ